MTEDRDTVTDSRDSVTDRVADRFESDGQESKSDKNAKNVKSSKKAKNSKSAKPGERALQSVKDQWTATSVYLPDDIDKQVDKQFKLLDLDLDDEMTDLRKTRHFYPLLVQAGLRELRNADAEDLLEDLEDIDPDLDEFRTR